MIDKLKSAARFAWDVLVPRFLSEDVAMRRLGPGADWDNFEIVCSMQDVEFWERFDGIATVDSFQAFGFGFAYRVRNFRAWGEK